MTFHKTSDVAKLTILVAEAKVATHALADFLIVDMSLAARAELVHRQDNAWRIAIEISADVYGTCLTALTMISPEGERKVFASIAEGSSPDAH